MHPRGIVGDHSRARASPNTARHGLSVASPSGGPFTTLSPRQPLMPAPMALALRGLRTIEPGDGVTFPDSWNVLGGHPENSIDPNAAGATISGGG